MIRAQARSPGFVADFDSATGFVRALAAGLAGQPFRNLGRSALIGRLARASAVLPSKVATAAFARAGGREAIPPRHLDRVNANRFGEWVTAQYPDRPAPAVAIGASNGALTHLWAASGIPWLPQTFLVPVARDGNAHEPAAQLGQAAAEAQELLDKETDLALHDMHDPNQDTLMVSRLAYFRMKQRRLNAAYRDYLERVLPPGGTVIVVNCAQRWPVTRQGERHVFQPGAVGGLEPEDYMIGSPAVERFLHAQGEDRRHWDFPRADDIAPEAEWGYDAALTDDVCAFARQRGYRVLELRFPEPEAPSSMVADLYRDWYAAAGCPPSRLLVETFICVEPHWTISRRALPLWLTFPVRPSAARLSDYLATHPGTREVLITLFPNGVRSAGLVPTADWLALAQRHGEQGRLVGVDPSRWPADFASLARYAAELHRRWPATGGPELTPMPLGQIISGAESCPHIQVAELTATA